MPTLLAAADLLEEAATVVIAGNAGQPLASVALAAADPAVVVLRASGLDALPADHPAFGKSAGAAGATVYVCRDNACGLPLVDRAALAEQIGTRRRYGA